MRYLIFAATLAAGCATIPSDATPVVAAMNAKQAEALQRSREQNEANLRTFAERVKAENAARIEARFVARLGTDSRPTDEVLAEVAARDAALAASAKEIDAALAQALNDANGDAAMEINALTADYLSDETERIKAERRVRTMLNIGEKK